LYLSIQKKPTDVGVELALDSKKVLQAVNLSPDESIVEKLAEVHPMRQITYASVLQVVVLFSMFGCMAINEQIITYIL
jgi:hypothetical protein